MSETQESTRLSSDRMLIREHVESAEGRSENIIAFGAVAIVSLVVGFVIGLLF